MSLPIRGIIPGPRHLLDGVHWTRDADGEGYGVALAYCKFVEDCTGSGKHSMARLPFEATCTACHRERLEREERHVAYDAALDDDEPLDLDRLTDQTRAAIENDLGVTVPEWKR